MSRLVLVTTLLMLSLSGIAPAAASTQGAGDLVHVYASGASVRLDESDEQQVTVYVTRTGAKYHMATCHHLRSSKIAMTKSQAVEKGYTPCSACFKSQRVEGENKTKKSDPPAAGGRCQATTKKGTQCKRSAKAGSRYCWQHG